MDWGKVLLGVLLFGALLVFVAPMFMRAQSTIFTAEGWSKKYVVTVGSGSANPGELVRFDVPEQPEMCSDFSDLRFVDENGHIVPFRLSTASHAVFTFYSGSPVSDVIVRVELNDDTFEPSLFSRIMPDCSDIRFSDQLLSDPYSDPSLTFPQHIDVCDPGSHRVVVYVRIPSLDPAGTPVYMYFGQYGQFVRDDLTVGETWSTETLWSGNYNWYSFRADLGYYDADRGLYVLAGRAKPDSSSPYLPAVMFLQITDTGATPVGGDYLLLPAGKAYGSVADVFPCGSYVCVTGTWFPSSGTDRDPFFWSVDVSSRSTHCVDHIETPYYYAHGGDGFYDVSGQAYWGWAHRGDNGSWSALMVRKEDPDTCSGSEVQTVSGSSAKYNYAPGAFPWDSDYLVGYVGDQDTVRSHFVKVAKDVSGWSDLGQGDYITYVQHHSYVSDRSLYLVGLFNVDWSNRKGVLAKVVDDPTSAVWTYYYFPGGGWYSPTNIVRDGDYVLVGFSKTYPDQSAPTHFVYFHDLGASYEVVWEWDYDPYPSESSVVSSVGKESDACILLAGWYGNDPYNSYLVRACRTPDVYSDVTYSLSDYSVGTVSVVADVGYDGSWSSRDFYLYYGGECVSAEDTSLAGAVGGYSVSLSGPYDVELDPGSVEISVVPDDHQSGDHRIEARFEYSSGGVPPYSECYLDVNGPDGSVILDDQHMGYDSEEEVHWSQLWYSDSTSGVRIMFVRCFAREVNSQTSVAYYVDYWSVPSDTDATVDVLNPPELSSESEYDLEVVYRDGSGSPIPDAYCALWHGGVVTSETNADGRAVLSATFVPGYSYQVVCWKSGYKAAAYSGVVQTPSPPPSGGGGGGGGGAPPARQPPVAVTEEAAPVPLSVSPRPGVDLRMLFAAIFLGIVVWLFLVRRQ